MTPFTRRRQPMKRSGAPVPSEDTMTAPTYQHDIVDGHGEPLDAYSSGPVRPLSSPSRRSLSQAPTTAGILIAAAGLLLIGIAWSQVAGEANVARQIPYVVSGGIFGLALVLIGALVVNVSSKRRETELRERQTRLLADAVRELGRALEQGAARENHYEEP